MESSRPTGVTLAGPIPADRATTSTPSTPIATPVTTVSPLVPVVTALLVVLAVPVVVAGTERTLRLALTAVVVTLAGVVWRLWLTAAVADDLRARLARSARPDPTPGAPPPAAPAVGNDAMVAALVAAVGTHSRHGQRPPIGVLTLAVDGLDAVGAEHDQRRVDDMVRSVLARVEAALTANERLGDVGGGRFVVITTGAPTDRDLELVATRLVAAATIADPAGGDPGRRAGDTGGGVPVGLSVGLRAVTVADDDPWAVLRDAGIACDRARSGGGGRIVLFDHDLRRRVVDDARFDRELRRAVRHREIDVHYQPIVAAASTDDVVQLEALVRWSHPVRHLVLPGAILRSAERQRLINELGAHVLDRACEQASRWSQRSGRAVSVSVNLHGHQLRPEAEIERVAVDALRRWSLAPHQLGVEVAVSTLVDDRGDVAACLDRLVASGVAVALDGVGLGDDVEARLDSLPMISCVKLDGAQLVGLDAPGLLPAVLGRVLDRGVELIVRNVERPEQLRTLQGAGADLAGRGRLLLQGFAIHRPATPTALDRFVGADAAGGR
ncbi:MAG: EAL domain-containing protein [Acidimicrobiales bacterium]